MDLKNAPTQIAEVSIDLSGVDGLPPYKNTLVMGLQSYSLKANSLSFTASRYLKDEEDILRNLAHLGAIVSCTLRTLTQTIRLKGAVRKARAVPTDSHRSHPYVEMRDINIEEEIEEVHMFENLTEVQLKALSTNNP